MQRALQLARNGQGHVSPNPMVGAVIVRGSEIIGEGWHRRYGEGHAEVNAIASVADKSLLRESTMYVTLEPCAHYGKTPPCARLIVEMGIPRVVVGCQDPFAKVSGRGIEILREAGVEVEVGMLEAECLALNHKFIFAHNHQRPYTLLKWAQSADNYLWNPSSDERAIFSTPLSQVAVHRLRSQYDAIMVGAGTIIADNPALDVRLTAGRDPIKVILDRRGRIAADARALAKGRTLYFTSRKRDDMPSGVEQIIIDDRTGLDEVTHELYRRGITSLMVEGGATLLRSFIAEGLWNEMRVETAPITLGSAPAESLVDDTATLISTTQIGRNTIRCYMPA